MPDGSDTEHSSSGQESVDKEAVADTRVLKMLYKGFFFEDIGASLHRSQSCTTHFDCYKRNEGVSVTEMKQHVIECLV